MYGEIEMPNDYNAPRRTTENTLARARIDKGMTQAQLAEAIGTDQRKVSEWERGVFDVPAAMLIRLSKVLGLPVESMLSEKPVKGSPIAEARKAKGLTQVELAKAVGVSQGLISTYENGAHVPEKTLVRISEVLNVDIETIRSNNND